MTPAPGSKEAIEQGCTCPVGDNYHGKGFPYGGETAYCITQGCPLHASGIMDTLLEAVGYKMKPVEDSNQRGN